jgi:hypothetical protein
MKKIVSIDLETLDVQTNSVIMEIGIVVGDDNGMLLEQFRMYPNINQQIAAGRSVSGETILWWLEQDEQARLSQVNGKRSDCDVVRAEFEDFYSRHKDAGFVLGNAPSFDCDILSSFLGYKPWGFWIERDVRTARMAVPRDQRYVNHQQHDALADAMAQYMDFVTFLNVCP